jgi:hypothetical protein
MLRKNGVETAVNSLGVLRYESTEDVPINANTAGTIYAICALRLKPTHVGAAVRVTSISLLNETNDDYEWMLIFNPTLANDVAFIDVPSSAVQFAVGNPGAHSDSTVTGGVAVSGGYVKASSSAGDVSHDIKSRFLLGSRADGTLDEVYLCVRPLSANADISGSIIWREFA